jgi:hypothetical protein
MVHMVISWPLAVWFESWAQLYDLVKDVLIGLAPWIGGVALIVAALAWMYWPRRPSD